MSGNQLLGTAYDSTAEGRSRGGWELLVNKPVDQLTGNGDPGRYRWQIIRPEPAGFDYLGTVDIDFSAVIVC